VFEPSQFIVIPFREYVGGGEPTNAILRSVLAKLGARGVEKLDHDVRFAGEGQSMRRTLATDLPPMLTSGLRSVFDSDTDTLAALLAHAHPQGLVLPTYSATGHATSEDVKKWLTSRW